MCGNERPDNGSANQIWLRQGQFRRPSPHLCGGRVLGKGPGKGRNHLPDRACAGIPDPDIAAFAAHMPVHSDMQSIHAGSAAQERASGGARSGTVANMPLQSSLPGRLRSRQTTPEGRIRGAVTVQCGQISIVGTAPVISRVLRGADVAESKRRSISYTRSEGAFLGKNLAKNLNY